MSEKRFTISVYSMLLITALMALTLAIANSLGLFSKRVVVAKGYFDILTVLTAEDVELRQLSFSFAPDNAVSGLSEVVGKTVITRLVEGQIILSCNVTSDTSLLEMHVSHHNSKVVPFLVDEASKDFSYIRVGQFVSVSKSGEEILNSVRVYEIDFKNNILELVVSSEESIKLISSSNRKLDASLLGKEKWSGYIIEPTRKEKGDEKGDGAH